MFRNEEVVWIEKMPVFLIVIYMQRVQVGSLWIKHEQIDFEMSESFRLNHHNTVGSIILTDWIF